MIGTTNQWASIKVLFLSLGISIAAASLSPTPSHAIPSAGIYNFTSGLTGTFTSNGTTLTDWAFKDPNSSIWLPGIWTPGVGTVFSNNATTFAQTDPFFFFDVSITWTSSSWVAVAPTVEGIKSVITGTLSYSLQQSVPEPSGLALLSLGLGTLALVRYIKRQLRQAGL